MGIYLDQFPDQRISAYYLSRARLGYPIDLGLRKSPFDRRKGGQSMDNVADRSKFYEKDLHVKSMLPKLADLSESKISGNR
jgi:hypothetical protein